MKVTTRWSYGYSDRYCNLCHVKVSRHLRLFLQSRNRVIYCTPCGKTIRDTARLVSREITKEIDNEIPTKLREVANSELGSDSSQLGSGDKT